MRAGTSRLGTAVVKAQPRALARRYARALLDVASAQGPAAAQALQQELAELARLVETHEELRRVLLHPALGNEARQRVLAALAEEANASPLVRRLLALLGARDRVGLLPGLVLEYSAQLAARGGHTPAEAVSAVPLTDSQKTTLASALSAAVGKTVDLESRVDSAVLGGLLVRVAGRTYDGTVRAQLAALRRQLAAGS